MVINSKNVCIVSLLGDKNYAIISPDRIVYALGASNKDLHRLCKTEEKLLTKYQNIARSKSEKRGVSIGIIPTFDCNLRCVYCYARGGDTKEYISLKTAQIAIEKISDETNQKHIDLYLVGGGEPLLDFNLVFNIVEIAKSLYKSVKIHLVTNGTFDRHVFEWLIENKADIRISYDGVRHTYQRPFASGKSSRDAVRENIKLLVGADLYPTIQCIITREGTNSICDTIDEVATLGAKRLKIEPALATDVSRSGRDIEPSPREYAVNLLQGIKHVVKSKYSLKIDTGYVSTPSSGYYCGISDPNKTVTPQGLITACVEVSRPTDPYADLVIYGRISDEDIELDKKKSRVLNRLHFNLQRGGCRSCNLRFICQGGCPMANIWRSGLPYRKSRFICTVEHILLPRLLFMIAEDSSIGHIVFDDTPNVRIC